MIRSLSTSLWLAGALAWVVAVEAVSLPGCKMAAPLQKNLTTVRTTSLNVPGRPFGVVYAQQNDVAFVALNNRLSVLNTSTFVPTLIHEILLSNSSVNVQGAQGIALTHDGRHVLVTATLTALIVVDGAKAIAGSRDAVVGRFNGTAAAGMSAVEVSITGDDRYAFVSQEYGSGQTGQRGTIEVFKLDELSANGTVSAVYIGYLPLDHLVVGTAFSIDGRFLYATSEQVSQSNPQGTLSVIDVRKLKSDPSNALVSKVNAGCGPGRVIVSRDGRIVWVTARQSNALLAFDAWKLVSNQSSMALLASVQVGTAPVGLIFAGAQDSRIVTANSNRFLYPNATAGLSVVDVDAALHGGKANLGEIPTGFFPRELAISPNGETILVSEYGSAVIQAVDVSTLL